MLAVTLVAGTIGGVVGFGSAVILLPVCAKGIGAAQARPILTIAALIGNPVPARLSRGLRPAGLPPGFTCSEPFLPQRWTP